MPTSQAQWQSFLNSLQQWAMALQQQNHPPNVIPSQFQTFLTSSAAPVLAALTAVNCTPSIDAANKYYGAASLKVASITAGGTLTFSGTPIAISPATKWFCSFQILAPSGCTGSLTVKTSGGSTVTESFTVPSSASWQQVWGLFDLSQYSDPQATWVLTFTSTATVNLDGMQMNAIGKPLGFLPKFTGSQMVLGASAYAANLDGVPDGVTYQRPLATSLTSGQVDLSKAGVISKTLANITDDSSSGRYAGTQAAATADGFQILSNTDFVGGALTNYGVYDNNGSGKVTLTAVADATTPNSSGYKMEIQTASGSPSPSPGLGGFDLAISADSGAFAADSYHKGSDIIWRIRANLPVGYTINWASNATGNEGTLNWLTSQAGTGGWFDYVARQHIGVTGTFSSTGFFYVGTGAAPVTWYVAVCSATCVSFPQGVGIPAGFVDPNRRALIDFTQAAHVGKTLTNVPDGAGRFAVINAGSLKGVSSVDGANLALIDFSQAGHSNKTLTNIPDGASRFAVVNAGSLKGVSSVDAANKALIDFSQSGHTNKTLTNIPDGASRFAVVNAGSMKGVASVDSNNKALIDFTQSGHTGKSLANVPDDAGSSRYAVLGIDGNRRALIDFVQAHTNPAPYWTPSVLAASNCLCSHEGMWKTGGTGGNWDTAAVTSVGYTQAAISAYTHYAGDISMIGFTTAPTSSVSYTNLNYCWYCNGSTWEIYESGGSVGYAGPSVKTSDRVSITYDSATVRYYLNGALIRSVTVAIGSALYGMAALQSTASGWINVEFGPFGITRQVHPHNGHIAPHGSVPPTLLGGVSFSWTTTTGQVVISWGAFTLYRMDGTTSSISGGSQTVTALTNGTVYTVYPFVSEASLAVSFADGFTGSTGSPLICYAGGSATAAAEMYNQANVPLNSFTVVPSAGGGGGGGNATGCLHSHTMLRLADGTSVPAGALEVGDELPGPAGPTRVTRVDRMPCWAWWTVRVVNKSGYRESISVTPEHRFLRPDQSLVPAHELKLGEILAGDGHNVSVVGLELLHERADLISIDVEAPHLYYASGILSHNGNPKP